MAIHWRTHAAVTAGVLLFACCTLLSPVARDWALCALRGAPLPHDASSVRLLGGLPGLAAVSPMLLLDGTGDGFALHAPNASGAAALEMLAADAIGARLVQLPAQRGKGLPRGGDWQLRVARSRVSASCAYRVDAPLPSPPVQRLAGLTLVAHDTALAVAHYFHVIEHLLGLWAVRAAFFPGATATRLLFVGGKTRDVDISAERPKGRMLRQMAQAVFPNVSLVRPSDWQKAARRSALLIEAAAVSSRMTCQRNAPSAHLNKMLAAHAHVVRPHAGSFREALLAGMGVRLPPKTQLLSNFPASGAPMGVGAATRLLRVGVVDRGSSNRRLSAAFKLAVMEALRADGRFDASLVRFQDLPGVAAQLEEAAKLDIMIGCHGNGLTHALLMRPPAVLVELFPASINHADYQLHAELAGHRHFGWSDRDGLLVRSPYVVQCAAQYGVYARYRRKSDVAVFEGRGGNATVRRIVDLAHDLALAGDEEWRALVAPPGCARDGRM